MRSIKYIRHNRDTREDRTCLPSLEGRSTVTRFSRWSSKSSIKACKHSSTVQCSVVCGTKRQGGKGEGGAEA